MGITPKQYPPEIRQKAVRLVAAAVDEDSALTEYEAIRRIAAKMHVAEETVRRWLRKAQFDAGEGEGTTSAEKAIPGHSSDSGAGFPRYSLQGNALPKK